LKKPYTSYPASPEPPVSADGFQDRSIRPQSTIAATRPLGMAGAVVSGGSVVVVVGAIVVVVAHEPVLAAAGTLCGDALPALSTADTVYELLLDEGSPVSDAAVAGADTCFQKLLFR
jgi:hypothetical protein